MVASHPSLNRRFRNTDSIVKANKQEYVSALHSKFPEDYVDINTHNALQKVKPWIEFPSPITERRFGIMSNVTPPIPPIPPGVIERWERQRKYGFTSLQQHALQPITVDKILILCIDFDDKPASISTEAIYGRFFEDYTNSLKEYYKEVSYSRYIPHGEIHGWYRAPNPSTFYTNKENGFGKYPNSAERLIEDAIDAALQDPDIDWTRFDTNDNGYIDNLIVIHSGPEAAWTGNVDDFWAHVYIIPEPKIIQGRYVWVYALLPEYLDTPENYRLVGIDCHEHGHQLGLPDLYDYTDESNGVGIYSLMGGGSWALKGSAGVHLDAWSKYMLGFSETIDNPTGTIYLDNAEMNSNIIRYTTSDPKEFFLVENRQKILYDTYLPSDGLFIWHINENQMDNQKYNNDKTCYLVGLVQSDNLKDLENRANSGDLGDPFPGILNNRSFGISTKPKSELCNATVLDILIKNISDSANTISFESYIPGPLEQTITESEQKTVAQAGISPAQTIILTGLVTGAMYDASKKK